MKAATKTVTMTESQAAVLRFVCETYRKGYLPTVREIGEHFGWSSPNAVQRHLQALEKKRLIERRGINRSFRLLPAALRIY